MSKKEKLKAQAQRQTIAQKELREQERLDAEEARLKQSRAAKKLLRQSRRGGREPWYMLVLKLLMLLPFMYSGFFHGGVLVAGIFGGAIEPSPPMWVGWASLIGTLVILAGIVFQFRKNYIIGFCLIAGGTVAYMKAAGYMIGQIQYRLENYNVRESLQGMDKEYMQRHYPILGCLAIAFILLVISVVKRLLWARRRKRQQENAPVQSIVED